MDKIPKRKRKKVRDLFVFLVKHINDGVERTGKELRHESYLPLALQVLEDTDQLLLDHQQAVNDNVVPLRDALRQHQASLDGLKKQLRACRRRGEDDQGVLRSLNDCQAKVDQATKDISQSRRSRGILSRPKRRMLSRFSILPSCSFVSKHIHLDCTTFHAILKHKFQEEKKRNNKGKNKDKFITAADFRHQQGQYWSQWFNMDRIISGEGYEFANHICTDGVSCSIMLRRISPLPTIKSGWKQLVKDLEHEEGSHQDSEEEEDSGSEDGEEAETEKENESSGEEKMSKKQQWRSKFKKLTGKIKDMQRTLEIDKMEMRSVVGVDMGFGNFIAAVHHTDPVTQTIPQQPSVTIPIQTTTTGRTRKKKRRKRKRRRRNWRKKKRDKQRREAKYHKPLFYTNGQYQFEAKVSVHKRQLNERIKAHPEIRRILNGIPSNKVWHLEGFVNYFQYVLFYLPQLMGFYGHAKVLRQRLDGHIARKRTLDSLCHRLTNGDRNAVIALGCDGNKGHPRAPLSAVPTKAFNERLRRYCTVIQVDEYNTSNMCFATHHKLEGPKGVRIPRYKWCMTDDSGENKRVIWNRDVNAALNMKVLLEMEIQGAARPDPFKRDCPSGQSEQTWKGGSWRPYSITTFADTPHPQPQQTQTQTRGRRGRRARRTRHANQQHEDNDDMRDPEHSTRVQLMEHLNTFISQLDLQPSSTTTTTTTTRKRRRACSPSSSDQHASKRRRRC